MKLLLLALLALPARADLTIPLHGAADQARDRAKDKAEDDADTAARYPKADEFKPMVGTWNGRVPCNGETHDVTLKFDVDDPKYERRAFIIYTLKAPSYGGYMSSLTLTPQAKKGVYLSRDGGGKLPPLEFDVSGRILVGHPPMSAGLSGLSDRVQVRMTFDARWRSVQVSLLRGGSSCAGTLKRR
ncbi:MAG TPA: hypothetical protein VN915_16305 [Elusimicrobiota bacterium]|nr:hypothetical protein [Elusimicrobiota bacterium]